MRDDDDDGDEITSRGSNGDGDRTALRREAEFLSAVGIAIVLTIAGFAAAILIAWAMTTEACG